jgi:hypothetical protein
VIDIPNFRPAKMTVGISSNSKVFKSTFNNSSSAITFAGSYFTANLSYDDMTYGSGAWVDEAAEMEAFICELNGKSGIAKIPMFHRPGAEAKGNPVVSASGELGGLLSTSGWTPNELVLTRGQYITINNELKMVMVNLTSDASGLATIEFVPWLRKSPDIGEPVITKNPYGIFRLTSDDQDIDFQQTSAGTSLDFEEAFYV